MELAERLAQARTAADFDSIERDLGGANIVGTISEVAAWWGYHEQTVKGWRGEGCPGEEGHYDLREIARWRVAKAERRGGDDSGDESERASRRKISATKAARDELRLRKELGQLVERDSVMGELREMFSIIRARLQALPGEIVSGVSAEERSNVMEQSTAKVIAALKELAKYGSTE